jgi:hypothetical protein
MTERDILEDDGRLVIQISPEQAVTAAALAKLLSALSRDYARSSGGRALIVSDVEHGSILLILKDALEAIEGIVAIADFARLLARAKAYFQSSNGDQEEGPNADASLVEMFKIAVEANASIRVTRGSHGKFVLEVLPEEAKKLKKKRGRKQSRIRSPDDPILTDIAVSQLLAEGQLDTLSPDEIANAVMLFAKLEPRGIGDIARKVNADCAAVPTSKFVDCFPHIDITKICEDWTAGAALWKCAITRRISQVVQRTCRTLHQCSECTCPPKPRPNTR